MWHLVITDLIQEGTGTASNLISGDFCKDMKWSWKRRLGWPGYLIVQLVHRDAWGKSCWRYNCVDMQKAKFLYVQVKVFTFSGSILFSAGVGVQLQTGILVSWSSQKVGKSPPMWTRKQDFASPWETASNPMAPSLTSRAEMVLHHGKKETMKVVCLLSLGPEKCPLLGRAVRWMATTVAGQERAGGDGSWLQDCSEGLHLLERLYVSSGHGT